MGHEKEKCKECERVKGISVGEWKKFLWDIDLPEPEDMSNDAFIKRLAQAIHDKIKGGER